MLIRHCVKTEHVEMDNTQWGSISGNIENQKDLVDYIESHGGEGGGVSKEYVDEKIEETKQFVEDKHYLTEHQPLKTINNQSLIGEGNIEIQGGEGGGLTPEERQALGLLTDTHKGVLKTTEFKAGDYVNEYMDNLWSAHLYSSTEHTTPGEFWFWKTSPYQTLCKFNPDTLEVETWQFNEYRDNFIWSDNSGRLYIGRDFVNFDTLQFEYEKVQDGNISMNGTTPSIFHIGDEILDIWSDSLYIFNEETQEFEICQFDTDVTFDYPNNIMYYEGSLVCPNQSMKLVKVADKHYKWESWTPEFNMVADGFYLEPKDVHYVPNAGYFFYVNSDTAYILDGTEWIKCEVNNPSSAVTSMNSSSAAGNFLIAKRNDTIGLLAVGDVKKTSWGNIDDEYVTLNTNQKITGNKTFTGTINGSLVDVNTIYVSDFIYNGKDLKLSSQKQIKLDGQKLKFNDSEVALKSDLIVNTEIVTGNDYNKISDSGFGTESIFKLGTDVFQCSYNTEGLIWDGSEWQGYQFPFQLNEAKDHIKLAAGHYFIVDNSFYIWEYVQGNFEQINTEQRFNYSDIYPLGDKLVVTSSNYYFDYESRTWIEGDVYYPGVNTPFVKTFNGVTYYNDYTTLYKFNEDGTMESLAVHEYTPAPYNYFYFNGDVYVVDYNGVERYNPETSSFEQTDIYYEDVYYAYFEQNGKLYCSYSSIGTGLVESTSYTKPEVPATGNKYQLTGQVVDDKTIYSWEQGGEGGGVSQEYVDNQISQVRSEIPQLVEVNDDTSEWNKELGYTNEDNTMSSVLGAGQNYAGIVYTAGDHTSSVMLSTEGVEITGENVKINDLDLSGLTNDKIVMSEYNDGQNITRFGEDGVDINNGGKSTYLNKNGIGTYGYFDGDEQGISLGYDRNNKSLLSVYDDEEGKNVQIQADGISFNDGELKLTNENIVTKDSFKTINGESIIGDGNITIQGGGSAPYALGELTPDESGEMLWTLNETDVAYILTNQPDKIVVMDAYILSKFVGMEGDVIYNMTVVEDESITGYKCEVTEDGGTFEMVAKEFVQTTSIWTGTEAEWNQLSDDEKASYTIALIR